MRRPLIARCLALVALSFAACGGDDGGGGAEANVVIGDADEGIEGVQSVRVPPNTHTEATVDYGLQPPAGGFHNPVWLNCGFYDEVMDDENLVHDVEHGAVWLAYSPDLTEAEVSAVHDLTRANPKVVATPYPGLADGAAVVATAWARQLTLESVDDARLPAFIDQYVDASSAPESGVTCSDSPLGEPIP